MRQINKNVAPAAEGPGGCRGCSRQRGCDKQAGLITLKGHLLLLPHSAALSLQVTEWGGFRPSPGRAPREPGGYKKRRLRAAGRQRRKRPTAKGQRGQGGGSKHQTDHSLTDASMGSSAITVSFLLFLAFQLPGQTGANPMYGSVSNADLMDFKVGPGKRHGLG